MNLHSFSSRSIGIRFGTALLALSVLAPTSASAISSTWFGGTGLYSTAANWDSNPLVPNNGGGNNFDVIFNAGQINLDMNAVVDSLSWSSGTLSMTGGSFVWETGALTISSNTGRTIQGGATLRNTGSAVWSGDALINFNAGGGTIENTSTGVFDITGNGTIQNNAGTGSFVNAGLLKKSAGAGTTTFNTALINTGTVDAQAGTLRLNAGGSGTASIFRSSGTGTLTFASGTFNLDAASTIESTTAGSSLRFEGATVNHLGTYNAVGPSFVTGGGVTLSMGGAFGGGLTVSGGTLSLNGASTMSALSFSNGQLNVGAPTTNNGAMSWTGGTLAGANVLTTGSGGTLTISSNVTRSIQGGVTLRNTGIAVWSGDALINFNGGGGTIENTSTGFFTISGNGILQNNAGTGSFQNAGILSKSSFGTTVFNTALNNSNLVNVDSGTLRLNNGGSGTGATFQASSTGILAFAGGTLNLDAASALGSIAAGAVLRFEGATVNDLGTYNAVGSTVVTGGAVTLSMGGAFGGGLNLSGGVLNLNGASTMSSLAFSNGQLNVNAATTNSGAMSWTAGTLAGANVLTTGSGGALTISGNTTRSIQGGVTLRNTGSAVWSGDAQINFNAGGGTVENTSTGVFDMTGNGTIQNNAGIGSFVNAGLLKKSAGVGTTTLNTALNNTGTLEVSSGALRLNVAPTNYAASTLTGGTWRVFSGSNLQFGFGPPNSITTNRADVTLSGTTSVFVPIDSLTLNDTAGAFRLLANRSFTAGGAFTNKGIIELGGGTFGAPSLVNQLGAQLFGFGAVTPQVQNAGTVRAAGGTLTAANGISGNGTVDVDPGATLNLASAPGASSAATLIQDGSLALGAQNINVSADYTNANFGVGNAFNPRANVTGTGQIAATGDVAQALSGDVVNGSSSVATTDFGNVHVGDVIAKTIRIENTGTTGPALRGAIQTTANGANLTDARLSGAAVTAGNWGPIAAGADSGDLNVLFTASSAGALVGQKVHVINNFDDVGDQDLLFTGSAYGYAAAAVTPDPVDFGIVHVGDVVGQLLTVTNTAPGGGFSEGLSASFSGTTGGVTASGATGVIAATASDGTSLSVGINTATAGDKTGQAIVALVSDGTGTSGLGSTSLGTELVDVIGQVNQYADADVILLGGDATLSGGGTSFLLDFGVVLQYAVVSSLIDIVNDVLGDPAYIDLLDGSFLTAGDAEFLLGDLQAFTGIAGGDTTDDFTIGFDTSGLGLFTGTITLDTFSTNDDFYGALAPITIQLQGEVVTSPEPTSVVLLVIGLGGLTLAGRRRVH